MSNYVHIKNIGPQYHDYHEMRTLELGTHVEGPSLYAACGALATFDAYTVRYNAHDVPVAGDDGTQKMQQISIRDKINVASYVGGATFDQNDRGLHTSRSGATALETQQAISDFVATHDARPVNVSRMRPEVLARDAQRELTQAAMRERATMMELALHGLTARAQELVNGEMAEHYTQQAAAEQNTVH